VISKGNLSISKVAAAILAGTLTTLTLLLEGKPSGPYLSILHAAEITCSLSDLSHLPAKEGTS
jgi:hypothetical protein